MDPDRARIKVPLAGLGQEMLNWLCKIRSDMVHLSCKKCHNKHAFGIYTRKAGRKT